MFRGTGVLCSATLYAATISAAATAAEATASASAEVIQPLAITRSADLVFGAFAAGSGGSVTVSPSGVRAASGTTLSSVGATPTAAQFDVTGAANASYTLSTTGTSATLVDGVAHSMVLVLNSELTGATATSGTVVANGTLPAGGRQSLQIGGTLRVDAAQTPGVYAGIISVTIEYN
jgi:hypothetical protein